MNIIELIKDAAFFGGHIPNERLDECRYFFDNVIEKQCIIPVVVKLLPQDNYCKVCNLPTDGEKCYSKRCPV